MNVTKIIQIDEKNEQDMPFPNEGGYGHVGWHI